VAAELRAEPCAAGIGPTTGDEGTGAGTSVDWTVGGGALATGMGVWHALRRAAATLHANANNQNLCGSEPRFLCRMMVLSLQFRRSSDCRFLTILPKKLVLKLT
jgi:hypothetical protein